jgi:hypothetical protein
MRLPACTPPSLCDAWTKKIVASTYAWAVRALIKQQGSILEGVR